MKYSWCCRQLHFGRVLSTVVVNCILDGFLSTVVVNCVSGGVLSTVKLIVFKAVFFSFAFHLDRLLYTQRGLMYIYLNDIQIQMHPVYIVILIAKR